MGWFEKDWLTKQGLGGTPAELKKLTRILEDELELRVGNEIAGNLTQKQLDEFEAILDKTDDEDADDIRISWLEKAYPDYENTTKKQSAKLEREFKKAGDKKAFIKSLRGAKS